MEKIKRILVCFAAFALTGLTAVAAETTVNVTVAVGGSTTVSTTTKATKWNCKATDGTGSVTASVNPTSSMSKKVTKATIKGVTPGTATVQIYSGSTTAGSGTLVKAINVTVEKAKTAASVIVDVESTTTYSCSSTKASAWKGSSSDESVATVTASGVSSTKFTPKITGVGLGTATITVENDSVVYTLTVTVSKKTGSPKSVSVAVGRSATVECDTSDAAVWTAKSSNESVAIVSQPPAEPMLEFSPVITGVGVGTATITVENETTIYTITVTVVEPPITLDVGEERTVETLTKGTSSVYWKCEVSDTDPDADILSVVQPSSTAAKSFTLKVTGLNPGEATVTVSTRSSTYTSWTALRTFHFEVLDASIPDSEKLSGALRISEVCPDDDLKDPNGVGAGFIELVNASGEAVNLSGYSLGRFNLGKEIKAKKMLALPDDMSLAAGERLVVWATEGYIEGGDLAVAEPLMDGGKIETVHVNKDALVLPMKISPKKRPVVVLYEGKNEIDAVVVPTDVPGGSSIVVLDPSSEDGNGATRRYLTAKPTPGAANEFSRAVALGPNVGPLYGVEPEEEISDLDLVAPAKPGEPYAVTLDVNPVYGGGDADAITSVTLVYRAGLNAATKTCAMSIAQNDPEHGDRWTAAIPAADLPSRGQLVQWKARITDKAGNEWTSPSFNNPDDGYEWYGTIVEPGTADGEGALSDKLQTIHIFAASGTADTPGTYNDTCLMNKDYDNISSATPLGARCAIYDSSTSNYYDNVRIDRRGNSSGDYRKKSHGLRFSKAKPFVMAEPWTHPVSGEKVKSIRKTSFVAEWCDPSYMRQMTSFWLLNDAGVWAPFEHPVRLNLNGAFYQLAFHSPRFTDELIEDIYGFDKLGYSYKNIGCWHLKNGKSTSGDAGTKKKTPDDGDETELEVLHGFFDEIAAAGNVKASQDGKDTTGLDNAALTKKVVEKFDLPAWINYLAATRITCENDDMWGNMSGYYDHADLVDGTTRGTDTWRPLAWDLNASWGQWYYAHDTAMGRHGLRATFDWHKSHPFYGGPRLPTWTTRSDGTANWSGHYTSSFAEPNYGVECVYQNTKFRRLYVRRLRTLMDRYFGSQNAERSATPAMIQMDANLALIQDEAAKDRALWGYLGTAASNQDCTWVNCWGTVPKSAAEKKAGNCQPANAGEAVDEIWSDYIVPRRTHLYETHSVNNTSKSIGYGAECNAGIPNAQSPIADLKEGITAEYIATLGAVVIRNANLETIDISGWKVAGPIEMTLPPGTVIDQKNGNVPGEVYVTADRRMTVTAFGNALSDQVVVGNGTAGAADAKIALTAADGTKVIYVPTPESQYLRLHSFDGVPAGDAKGDTGEWIVLTNISTDVKLDLTEVKVQFLKAGDPAADCKCVFTISADTALKAGKSIRFSQAEVGWGKITNGDLEISVFDADGVVAQYSTVRQKGIVGYCDKDGNAGPAYLRATSFEVTNAGGFEAVSVPMPIDEKQASAFDVEAIYDGTGFTIDTNGLIAAAGALPGAMDPKVDYALMKEGPYQDEPFVFTNACVTSFWYRISSAGYETFVHEARVTVERAQATVTADDAEKLFGADDPEFTATVTGTIGEDELVYEVVRTNASEEVGTYDLIASGDEIQGNYKVAYENGVFEIRAGKMTVNGKGYDNTTDAFLDLLQDKGVATFNEAGVVYDGMTFRRGATLTVADDESWTVSQKGGTSLSATKVPGKMNLTVDGMFELSGDIYVAPAGESDTVVTVMTFMLDANITVGRESQGATDAMAYLSFEAFCNEGDYRLTLTTKGIVRSVERLDVADVFADAPTGFRITETEIDGGYEYALAEAVVTVRIVGDDEITDVLMDGDSVLDETLELPFGTTQVELELVASGLTVPVFKVVRDNVTNVTTMVAAYTIKDNDTLEFFAEEAEEDDPTVTPEQTKRAIVDAIDPPDPEDEDDVERYQKAVGKVNAVVGTDADQVPAKGFAAYITKNSISSENIADCDYVAASVKLDTDSLIGEETEVEIAELVKAEGNGLTFEVSIEDDPVNVEAIKDMVEASSDLSAWAEHKLEVEATFVPGKEGEAGKVTITPKQPTDKAFMRVVIPKDPGVE